MAGNVGVEQTTSGTFGDLLRGLEKVASLFCGALPALIRQTSVTPSATLLAAFPDPGPGSQRFALTQSRHVVIFRFDALAWIATLPAHQLFFQAQGNVDTVPHRRKMRGVDTAADPPQRGQFRQVKAAVAEISADHVVFRQVMQPHEYPEVRPSPGRGF